MQKHQRGPFPWLMSKRDRPTLDLCFYQHTPPSLDALATAID